MYFGSLYGCGIFLPTEGTHPLPVSHLLRILVGTMRFLLRVQSQPCAELQAELRATLWRLVLELCLPQARDRLLPKPQPESVIVTCLRSRVVWRER